MIHHNLPIRQVSVYDSDLGGLSSDALGQFTVPLWRVLGKDLGEARWYQLEQAFNAITGKKSKGKQGIIAAHGDICLSFEEGPTAPPLGTKPQLSPPPPKQATSQELETKAEENATTDEAARSLEAAKIDAVNEGSQIQVNGVENNNKTSIPLVSGIDAPVDDTAAAVIQSPPRGTMKRMAKGKEVPKGAGVAAAAPPVAGAPPAQSVPVSSSTQHSKAHTEAAPTASGVATKPVLSSSNSTNQASMLPGKAASTAVISNPLPASTSTTTTAALTADASSNKPSKMHSHSVTFDAKSSTTVTVPRRKTLPTPSSTSQSATHTSDDKNLTFTRPVPSRSNVGSGTNEEGKLTVAFTVMLQERLPVAFDASARLRCVGAMSQSLGVKRSQVQVQIDNVTLVKAGNTTEGDATVSATASSGSAGTASSTASSARATSGTSLACTVKGLKTPADQERVLAAASKEGEDGLVSKLATQGLGRCAVFLPGAAAPVVSSPPNVLVVSPFLRRFSEAHSQAYKRAAAAAASVDSSHNSNHNPLHESSGGSGDDRRMSASMPRLDDSNPSSMHQEGKETTAAAAHVKEAPSPSSSPLSMASSSLDYESSDSSDESILTSNSESETTTGTENEETGTEDEMASPSPSTRGALDSVPSEEDNLANLLCAVAPGLPRSSPLVLGLSGGARAGKGSAAVLVRREGLAPGHLNAKRWCFDQKSQLVPFTPPHAPPARTALCAQPLNAGGSSDSINTLPTGGIDTSAAVGVGSDVILGGRTPNAVKCGPPDFQQWRRDARGYLATKAAPKLVLGLRTAVALGGDQPGSVLTLVPPTDPRAIRWMWISPTGDLRGILS